MPFPHDNPALVNELVQIYDGSATRLRAIVIAPPGRTASSQEFNQARAAQLMNQVKAETDRLKNAASKWTSKAVQTSVNTGLKVGAQQLAAAGVSPRAREGLQMQGSFSQIQHNVVRTLAQDIIGDLTKAADGMLNLSFRALRKMSATGVTNAEVNRILASRAVIEGKPPEAIRELRDLLEKVHGKEVTVVGPSGQPRTFETSYYAKMVATTKTREAVVQGSHAEFQANGINLVKIVGRNSIHFCTNYLGHVYSLDGRSNKYPALASLPNGGPPFHPNCSKSTTPFIEGLSKITARGQEAAA